MNQIKNASPAIILRAFALIVCLLLLGSTAAQAQCISITSVTTSAGSSGCRTSTSNCSTSCTNCVDVTVSNVGTCCISVMGFQDNAANPNDCFIACNFGTKSRSTCDNTVETMTNTANPLCPGGSTTYNICYATSGTKVDMVVNCCGNPETHTITLP